MVIFPVICSFVLHYEHLVTRFFVLFTSLDRRRRQHFMTRLGESAKSAISLELHSKVTSPIIPVIHDTLCFFLLIWCLLVCGRIFFVIHTKTNAANLFGAKRRATEQAGGHLSWDITTASAVFKPDQGLSALSLSCLDERGKLQGIYFTGSAALNSLSAHSLDAASQIKISLQQVLHTSFNRHCWL